MARGSKDEPENAPARATRKPRNVRMPVFVSDEPVGLGDAIKRVTSSVGVKPCGGCAQRAAWLNSRITFVSRGKSSR